MGSSLGGIGCRLLSVDVWILGFSSSVICVASTTKAKWPLDLPLYGLFIIIVVIGFFFLLQREGW